MLKLGSDGNVKSNQTLYQHISALLQMYVAFDAHAMMSKNNSIFA